MKFDDSVCERALGVYWNIENDTLSFKVANLEKPLTKRGILSMTSSIFDPLGYISPVIIQAKGIIQEMCRAKLPWDADVPEEVKAKWLTWQSNLEHLRDVALKRSLDVVSAKSIQLHHFCDASEFGFGVVTYIRTVNDKGKVTSSILMSKSRLAPIKKTTIPRLELSGAALAVKQDVQLRKELSKEIHLQESVFWTDSTIVLSYINNMDKRFHTFVANRIQMIHDCSNPHQWKHVPSKLNPADDISRGQSAKDLIQNQRWWAGPSFLLCAEDRWPEQPPMLAISVSDKEVKTEVSAFKTEVDTIEDPIDKLIKAHSSWPKLKKAIAWILAIREALQKKTKVISRLHTEHLEEAENALIAYIQKQHYGDEIKALKDNKPIDKTSSIKALQPVYRNGLICLGTRLGKGDYPEEFKFPPILPKNHHTSTLIVKHAHGINAHAGREYVMAAVRQKYWIISARSTIRKVGGGCTICSKRDSPPQQPRMTDLPADRITAGNPPWTHVGVDYFGPFMVKRGRAREKRYGCIFTCLAIRAIHIEVATSLDSSSFINCLQRFIARRGKPKTIRSDNGSNFIGANAELQRELKNMKSDEIQHEMNAKGIKWLFNPPYASNMGGVWERQIRSVRRYFQS